MNRSLLLMASWALALGSVAATPPALQKDAEATEKIRSISGGGKGEIATDAGMRRMLLLAKQDLAKRLKIEVEAIEVLGARHVTWRDSSLGCPQPNAQYMQVLSKGAQIKLKAHKRTYHYHSGEKRPLFYCEAIYAMEPLPGHFGDA